MLLLGQELRYARIRRKLTPGQVAQELGLSELDLYRYEKGICMPDVLTLDRLAGFYRVHRDLFFRYIPGADCAVIMEFRKIEAALDAALQLGAISRKEKEMVLLDFCRQFRPDKDTGD